MRAEDLRLEELVDFEEGRLSLKARRLVLHDMRAFGQFRRDLLDMVGWKNGRRILTRFGYFWGDADAAAMQRLFSWDNLREWLLAGPRFHTLQGVSRTMVRKLEVDEGSKRLEMELVWYDSGEVLEHLEAVGRAESPICWIMTGYASGYASYCLGRDVFFIEKQCAAASGRACIAVGKDADSWDENELGPHKLFFKADDIHGKVLLLTQEIRKKNRELMSQRKALGLTSTSFGSQFAEVRSESFRRVLELASRVAKFDSSILISGETGVGKEVIARFIHRNSPRSEKPFIGVNCTALPETLLESELFGHKAGAFTGAVRDRIGLFEQAAGGTIFLDEIGDISPMMQMKLLRVLQEKEIRRVGENNARTIDVRVLSATNKDLNRAIVEGMFREDLLYRLRVIEIVIPPLRQRPEDILMLARFFVRRLAVKLKMPKLRLDPSCLDYLQGYRWPGNVRELENALERAAILSGEELILPENLPPHVVRNDSNHSMREGVGAGYRPLSELERKYIGEVLEYTRGNRTKAAHVLGISPVTLWRKLKKGANSEL